MSAEFEVETLATFWPEAESLMIAHCLEVGEIKHANEFAFDLRQARQLEAVKQTLICTMRASGVLQGYCIWYVAGNIVRTGERVAMQSGWYLKPEARRGVDAIRLYVFALARLKDIGVTKAYPHFWPSCGERIAALFKRFGATPAEVVYKMDLT